MHPPSKGGVTYVNSKCGKEENQENVVGTAYYGSRSDNCPTTDASSERDDGFMEEIFSLAGCAGLKYNRADCDNIAKAVKAIATACKLKSATWCENPNDVLDDSDPDNITYRPTLLKLGFEDATIAPVEVRFDHLIQDADDVPVRDFADLYEGDNVEDILQEVGECKIDHEERIAALEADTDNVITVGSYDSANDSLTLTDADGGSFSVTITHPPAPVEGGTYIDGTQAPALDVTGQSLTYQTVNDADESAGAPVAVDLAPLFAALTSPAAPAFAGNAVSFDAASNTYTITDTDTDTTIVGTLTPQDDGSYIYDAGDGSAPVAIGAPEDIQVCSPSSDASQAYAQEPLLQRGNVGTIVPLVTDCPVGKASDGKLYTGGTVVSDGELVAADLADPDRPDLNHADIVSWRDATYAGRPVEGVYRGPNNQVWAFNIDKAGNVITKCLKAPWGGSVFVKWRKHCGEYHNGGQAVTMIVSATIPAASTVTVNYPITLSSNIVRIADGNGAGDIIGSPSQSGPVMRPAAGRTTTGFDAVNTGTTTIAVDHIIEGIC